MKKTLGLDLGSNSLGWAILDDVTGDVLDKGVIVFPEGMDADETDATKTKAAARRLARMGRRLKFRRKIRKWRLLELLIAPPVESLRGLCPLTLAELAAWKNEGKYPVGNKAFIAWLKSTDASNPYCDRAAAVEGKVAPAVLGRALYHLCQRRGFKSSRKEEAAQRDEEGNVKKDADKKLGAVKGGVKALSDEIAAAGSTTLGQHFFRILEREKGQLAKTRLRGRYTGRNEHYEIEFAAIMDAQGVTDAIPGVGAAAPGKSVKSFRAQLHDAIFYQRPLRSQKHLVGKCPLEPQSPRAQIGHPLFEEFRMLAFVNNLVLEDKDGNVRDDDGNLLYPLAPDDKRKIAAEATRVLKPTFKTLYAAFKKDPRFREKGLRFHYYDEKDALPNCPVRQRIAAAFGAVPYDEQLVFDAISFHDDETRLADWFRRHCPALDDAAVAKLAAVYPPEGNAQYSLKAIKRILPFLRRGLELSDARLCAKLPDVVPDYAAHEENLLAALSECHWSYRRDKAAYAELPASARENTPKPPSFLDRFKRVLLEYGMAEDDWKRLYLHGDETYAPVDPADPDNPRVHLPAVNLGMIRNPVAQRALTTLRRLVNYLSDHGKIDRDDTVRIEMARTVNDFATRRAWQLWQNERRATREEAAAKIRELGVAPSEDAIDRYVLWKEQNGKCLYTQKPINIADLFDESAFDVEHTVPRSLSGDDSLANKTICDAAYNRDVKKGRVPRDCPNWEEIDVALRPWREKLDGLEKTCSDNFRRSAHVADPKKKAEARAKAVALRFERDYWRDKLRRFDADAQRLAAPDGVLGGFKKRQLVDTGVICTHAVELLKCVYKQTYCVNGAATAFARKAWGLQSDGAKDRSEHTHHAVDAMTIAALTPARFTAICTALKDDGGETHRGHEARICPKPWPEFAENVHKAAAEILVRHVVRQITLRQSSKRNALAKSHPSKKEPGKTVSAVLSKGDTVRGPLHKDTFYGCIKKPLDGAKAFVVRKPLVGPLPAALAIADKIVDPAIRRLVTERLEELKAQGVKSINPGDVRMPSGVPVNKVRIEAHTTNPACLRPHAMPSKHAYKNPYYVVSAEGSNFRLALFEKDGTCFVQPDNSLAWAQNHKKPDYVPFDRQPGFVGYVAPGMMALTCHEGHPEELETLTPRELTKRLYKIVKFEKTGGVTFRLHTEARASVTLSTELGKAGKNAKGESKIAFDKPHELLRLSPATYLKQMLFEGIHFKMHLDGSIAFIRR